MSATLTAKPEAPRKSPAATPAAAPEPGRVAAEVRSESGIPVFLQAKLLVSQADDPYEREADQIADRVMRMPLPGALGAVPAAFARPMIQRRCSACAAPLPITDDHGPLRIQRKCAACAAKDERTPQSAPCESCESEERLQRQPEPASAGPSAIDGAASARVLAFRGGGEPLPQSARSYFEPRFGRDFGAIRVHTGERAAHSARELGAQAYTLGQDIVFGAGAYAPDSAAGRQLLAHELTHTIQQTGGEPRVQRSLLERLGLDDVCVSDVCVTDVAEGIGSIGVAGVTIGDLTAPAEDLAVSAIDATGADLSFVGDVARPGAELATAGLDALGVDLSLEGTELTATVEDIELGSLDIPVDLPSFSTIFPLIAIPLPPGLVAYAGIRLGLEPKLILSLGPIALRDIHISADPIALSVGGGGELSIEGAIAGIVVARGAIEGGVVVPELATSLSLEGGLRYTATGVARGGVRQRVELDLSPGSVIAALQSGSLDRDLIEFDSDTALTGALGLRIWLNAYAAARLDQKIFCEYIWPGAFWEAGRQWNVDLPLSASLGMDGISLEPREGSASGRDVPFDEIAPKLGKEPPLGLNCFGHKDILGEYDYEEPTEGIRICSRPLNFPIWTGLPAARHAFAHDPLTGANYAIREPLVWGNGVTTSCSPKTSASGAPDDVASSRCKPCEPRPGPPETRADRELEVSKCLQRVYNEYPGPNLYRNGPDFAEGLAWGPNSNSFAAAMAACCHEFDRTGLGILPGWDHGPAAACPPRTIGDTVQWILGLETPELRVFELARLGPDDRRAITADPNAMGDLEQSIGAALWPTALRILNGQSSTVVPSLSEATAYQADAYMHYRVPDRAGLHARVDALHVIVQELESRRILDPALARWSYVAGQEGDALTTSHLTVDPDTGEHRAEGPSDVEVYDDAFADVGWLFSTVMHEWVHVLTDHAGVPAEAFDEEGELTPEARARDEVEAYLWEIEHAVGTGVIGNAAQLSELGKRLTTEYKQLSEDDRRTYAPRYHAAMKRVRRAEAGLPHMTIDEARRIVQDTSDAIESALARRPGHEREVDAEIERLRRRRDAALIEVALADNPAIQVVRPGPRGDYRVPSVDPDGRVRFVHGGILVAWHLAPVPPSAFGLGEQLGSDPARRGEPIAIAGTAAQGRVHPYPPDVDFDEHLDIRAASAWDAGKQVTRAIIGFVDRNESRRNVEFTNMAVFRRRGGGTYFTREDVLAARDGDSGAFGRIAGAISRLGSGNLNTYWRGWVQDEPGRPPRFIAITKVMTIHAENSRTREVYIDSERFPDINLAFLDEPDAIPRGSLGTFAWQMCCEAVRRWCDEDYLKAAKRAYNYFSVIGDLENMARLEPLFRTPEARAAMNVSALDAVFSALVVGRRAVATRILTVDAARDQLRMAADGIETLPGARPGAGAPTRSPAEIAEALRELAGELHGTPEGLLQQNGDQARRLRELMNETNLHINLPLDEGGPGLVGRPTPFSMTVPQVRHQGVVSTVVGRLEREVCPFETCFPGRENNCPR